MYLNTTLISVITNCYSERVHEIQLMVRHTLGFEKTLKYCDITPFKDPLHFVQLDAMYFICPDRTD